MASEVDTFLEGLELKEYADAFKQNGFTNLQSCCTLNEDKLQELGVIKRGHQKRILRNLPVDALQSIQQDMSDMIDESGSRQSYPQGSGDTTSIIQMPEFDEKKYFLIPPVKHDISAKPHPVPQPRMRKIKPDLDYPAPMSSCEPSLKTLKQKPDVPPRPPSIGMRPVETPVTQSISNGQISNKESVIQIPSEKTPDLPAKTKPKPPVRTTPIMDNNSTSSPAVLPDTLKSCEDTTKIIDIIPSQPISRPPPINLRVSEPSPGTTASSRRTPDNMTASGPSPGTTTTSGPLAGNMTASGPSPGTITTSGPLAGNMTASGPSPGTTTTSGPLAGNMTDTGPSPGTTTTSGPLAGNMAASGPSPGTTTTSEPLAGNMTDTGPSPGTTTTSGPLAGNMTATGPSPGTTTTSGPLAGNMTASGPSPGTTTTSGPLVGNMTKFLDIIPPRPISGPPPINMRASGPSQGTTTISGIIPDNMTTSRQSTGNMTDSGPPPVNITDSGLSPGNMQASRPSPIEMTAIGHPSMAFGPSPGNSTSLSALKNKSDSDGEDYVSMGKSHIEDTNPEFDVDGTAYDILVNKTRNRAQPVTPRKTSDLINLRNSIAVELPSPQEPYNTINLLDSIEPIHMEDSCRSSKPPPDCPPPPPPFACKDPTPLQTFVKEVIDIDNLPPPPPPRVDSIYLEEPRPVSIPQASPARPAPPPPVPPTMIPLRIGNEFDGSVSGDIDDYEVLKPPHKPPQLPSLPALPNRRRPREPLPVPIPQAPPARLAPPPPDNPTIIPLIDGSEFDGSASGGIDDYEVLKPPHYSSQLPSLPAHPNIRHREQQPVPISQAPPVRSAPPPPDTPMKIPLVDDDDEFDDGASRDCQSEDSDTSDEMLDYDSRMNEISPKIQTLRETSKFKFDSVPEVFSPTAKSLEKSGFLYKQGGKQNTKGWRKRWVVFNGKDLRYYISKESKVSQRIIPVGTMCDVCVETAKGHSYLDDVIHPSILYSLSGDRPYRFHLTTKRRVYLFSSDISDEVQVWSSIIMSAIIQYQPPQGGFPKGGDMCNADKEGPVKIDGNKSKKYMAVKNGRLCYYANLQDHDAACPISEIQLNISSVKEHRGNKLEVVTPNQRCMLLFENADETKAWAEALEVAIKEALSDPTALLFNHQNPANKKCADCGDDSPDWTSINLLVVICKECSGCHRSLGVDVSKVRSLRMDKLAPLTQQLLLKVGNDTANAFWEDNLDSQDKITPVCEMRTRLTFIDNKYRHHRYSKHVELTDQSLLSIGNFDDNLSDVMNVVFAGVNLNVTNASGKTAYEVAKETNQPLTMEFLSLNIGCNQPASITDRRQLPSLPPIQIPNVSPQNTQDDYKGYLYKTSTNRKDFQKRWCTFSNSVFTYHVDDKVTSSPKNNIEARDILSISNITPEDAIKQSHTYCFEIGTVTGRTYLFSANKQSDKRQWVKTITKCIVPACILEHMEVFDRAGYLYKKESTTSLSSWQRSWFILVGKNFCFFSVEKNGLEILDLRKLISLNYLPVISSNCPSEVKQMISVVFPKRTLYIIADNKEENEAWFNTIKSTSSVSGRNLHEQQLTEDNIPVPVDRCIEYVANHGMAEVGIYRQAATEHLVKDLLDDFSCDARAVRLDHIPVHVVANALKRFFRNLPEPLLTKIFHDKWIEASGYTDHNNKLRWYKYYLEELPPINRDTMKKLIGHLKSVSECSKENRMVIENLAAVWGPTLLSSGDTFKDTNHEIVVIGDIIRYYDWLFGISDEEKKKKLAIEEARKKMEELHMNRQQIPDMMFSVNLYEFDGTSVNVKVNGTTTSDMCIKQLLNNTKLGIEPCTNYALFELLFKGSVVRPIHGSEKILDIYTKWGEKGKNNQVCLKENHVVDMCKASSSTAYGMVRISDKRAFKKLYLELTGRLLRLYKDSKSSSRHESELSLDQLFIYIGIDPNKATPTNYGLTFRDKNDVKANFRYICCESEYDYRRWIGGLFNAKYPDGFSCNRDISTATQSPVDGMYEYVSSGACKPAVIQCANYDGQIKSRSPLRETLGSRFDAFAIELTSKARKMKKKKN